ncbi:hypothetical protein [Spongiimicrobium salis]|uniref:hypothetical protein n=1 Tax=Spongiimicrobium salis TaxID=1667022 RepID=UPI00374DCECC
MKKFIGLAFLIFFLVAASTVTSSKPQEAPSLEGTWELVSHYNYDGVSISDTIPNADGYRQIKMYANGKVMWTRYVPKDSVEWFGYGSYENTENALVETLEYGSASMMKIIDEMRVFRFELSLEQNNFSQTTIDEEGNKVFSENYVRIK